MTVPETTGYYFYGFVHTPRGEPRDTLPLPNEVDANDISTPLQFIHHPATTHHPDIVALVRAINPADFAATLRAELAQSGQQLAADSWVARQAVLHDAIISQYLPLGICPARFGTILPDEQALHTLLERSYNKVYSQLKKLIGKQEWTLRLWLNKHTRQTSADPVSGGRAYLQARRDSLITQSADHAQAAEVREQLETFLSSEGILYMSSERVPPSDAEQTGAAEVIVLLDSQQNQNIRAHYTNDARMTLELRGPFAPYTFSAIDIDDGTGTPS
ncbi:MAG: GvpL/GvpF family gas vesicle protein [Deinococcota bacterium]